jgi:pimeloyl-ACP methyl ester carboxylesterase
MADVTARGVRFHVQRLGTAKAGRPAVVFLHGLVMDNLSSFYFTLANPVAQIAEVILYDLRGHGRSERPPSGYGLADMVADLAAILDATGATNGDPVILAGNSFGGLLGLAFAAAHPERARGVVLIDGHLGEQGWTEKMAATLELEGEERDRRIATSFEHWLGRHSEKKSTRLARSAAALVYETSLVRDLRASPALGEADLRAVRCPVLALYGESSDLRAEAERMAIALPSATLRVFPGCSHSILWEATAEVRDAVLAFVAEHAGPAPARPRGG